MFTDRTRDTYAWRLATFHEMPTIPAYPVGDAASVHIDNHRDQVLVFVGNRAPYYRSRGSVILAEASFQGRGQGWRVTDLPHGQDPTSTTVASKVAAVSLIKHAARVHAKALGLPVASGGVR